MQTMDLKEEIDRIEEITPEIEEQDPIDDPLAVLEEEMEDIFDDGSFFFVFCFCFCFVFLCFFLFFLFYLFPQKVI